MKPMFERTFPASAAEMIGRLGSTRSFGPFMKLSSMRSQIPTSSTRMWRHNSRLPISVMT